MTDSVDRIIDDYCRCWRQMDAAERKVLLSSVCADDVTYTDPTVALTGLDAFAAHIEKTMAGRPGGRIVRITATDRHHGFLRFGWHLQQGDGGTGAPSIDIVTFSPDGRLATILGFFGPMQPL
jgi:hypothetical protein